MKDSRLTAAGYPRQTKPRWRYRRPTHLQDTVVLELHVPASMIAWLEFHASFLGLSVEDEAKSMIIHEMERLHRLMWNNGAYGGRPALERARERVAHFLAEPVNCGPGAIEAKAFEVTLSEIHGGEL